MAQERSTLADLGFGTVSTAVGSVTGIPDLIGMMLGGAPVPVNPAMLKPEAQWTTQEQQVEPKTSREKVLGAIGVPTEGGFAYNVPDYITMAVGLQQLGKAGFTALRQWRKSSKVKKFLKTLPSDEANYFQKFMVTGQGSDDRRVAAAIQKLQRSPEYGEMFDALNREATKAAMASTAPTASKLGQSKATEAAVKSVQDRIDGLAKARSEAGNIEFKQARGYGAERPIVTMDNTLSKIRELRTSFEQADTPAAKNAVEFLKNLEDQITPTYQAPGYAGTTVARAGTEELTPVIRRGPLGEPIQAMEQTVTPPSSMQIPGSPGYSFTQGPQKFTIDKLQGWLSEFGKKSVQGDSLINNLSMTDEQKISKALFGALQGDLQASKKLVTDANDRAALDLLERARDNVRVASEKYNNTIAKGMPAFLQGKKLEEIEFADLLKAYKDSSPTQRRYFRTMVGRTNAEALKNIDSAVYDDFVRGAQGLKADGTYGIDLNKMAIQWADMSKDQKNLITSSMNVSPFEFDRRMRDALKFTRQMQVSQPAETAGMGARIAADVGRAVGTTAGYQAKQAVDLSADIITQLSKKGLSDDLLMKALLNPEAADTLKRITMTPNATEKLTELTKLKDLPWKAPAAVTVGVSQNIGASLDQPTFEPQLPPDLFGEPKLPPNLFQ